jgi:hypothetical protein
LSHYLKQQHCKAIHISFFHSFKVERCLYIYIYI